MDSRRDFIKKAGLLSGGVGIWSTLPSSIQKALAINPQNGTSFLDAEHIVLLMQENRSFDHTFGTLQGVRGFNDPRAITLPDQNPVWLQTNAAGETYAPFRLDIKDTKATWMESLPHSWTNQVDARNEGRYDKWLDVKKSSHREYSSIPMTMGYYTREDIPFYYAMADAFTVCDQYFCSSLTGTTPNRLFYWTGTIRAEQHEDSYANVWNENVDLGSEVDWHSFPELLEAHGVSWKIYQNEITMPMGFTDEEDAWLANFGDSPLQWFLKYQVRYSQTYMAYVNKQVLSLPKEIAETEEKVRSVYPNTKESVDLKKKLKQMLTDLATLKEEQQKYTPENFAKLSQFEKNLHEKAFSTNKNDPFYHELTTLNYKDENIERDFKIPKGDIFHQFREDVKSGNLPTVSWLVAPETFSDHPSSAWYGAWYVSEVLDILTQNPETWKKTIFILNYDENDGYFDHVPPFVAPHSGRPETGAASPGLDTRVEYVTLEQELSMKSLPVSYTRESPIGLGYRVPMVIASPWSRGGWVNSQVFDHSSCLQFLETFLSLKLGKKIVETNISAWRRSSCGDLSTAFRPYSGEKINTPDFLSRDAFLESIHKAQFKKIPSNYQRMTKAEIDQFKNDPHSSPWLPQQEKGIRPSCALPYQLNADGRLSQDKKSLELILEARRDVFGQRTAGAPFNVYAPGKFSSRKGAANPDQWVRTWAYAVGAGAAVKDSWFLKDFENEVYHLRVYGPNGFYREFTGHAGDPQVDLSCEYEQDKKNNLTGNILLKFANLDPDQRLKIRLTDHAYKCGNHSISLDISGQPGARSILPLNCKSSFGWYDFSVLVEGDGQFSKRYAGRVETGRSSFSDPYMGSVKI
jgi:phospholipase C